MSNFKISVWIAAARLRTLPLSLAGIIVGNGLAYLSGNFSGLIFFLSILTTIAFQVLSNLANDYGDGVKGTDNDSRIGPSRVLQQGLISRGEMKKGIIICTLLSFLLTLSLVVVSFSYRQLPMALFFLLLGIVAIISAIKYTVGSTAYGYFALGDVFVFAFFGFVSVLGSYFLQAQTVINELLLPAIAMGLLSTAVLNLNNMRDVENDQNSKKITVPILLGVKWSKVYHSFLVIIPFLTTCFYVFIRDVGIYGYSFLIFIFPIGTHLRRVWQTQDPKMLDPELKKVALTTFLFALIFVGGIFIARI